MNDEKQADGLAVLSSAGLGVAAEAQCMCKDRALTACPGEWEPGCDLGNNAKYVKVHQQTTAERKAIDEAVGRNAARWRPIVSAPRDGTWILVFDPDTEIPQRWVASWVEFKGDSVGGHWLSADLCHLTGATHWMPLPQVPNVEFSGRTRSAGTQGQPSASQR